MLSLGVDRSQGARSRPHERCASTRRTAPMRSPRRTAADHVAARPERWGPGRSWFVDLMPHMRAERDGCRGGSASMTLRVAGFAPAAKSSGWALLETSDRCVTQPPLGRVMSVTRRSTGTGHRARCSRTSSSVSSSMEPPATQRPFSRMRNSLATRRANGSFCSTSITVTPASRLSLMMMSPIS